MNKKNIQKAIVIASVAALSTVTTFATAFKDVQQTHWAYTNIQDMQKRGIMLSSSSGEFFPNAIINFFEISDILAKATGYVDVSINPNIDENLKKQILNNYEIQKPVLTLYEKNFTSWDKRYNEQIAYLLGRGYIQKAELDKFITRGTDQKETKNTVTKEELAVFIVRMLGKEETAKTAYTSTGFSDESLIALANRPHVAYLKSIGLVNPDAKGLFNPKVIITRALCAKMVSDALTYKEKQVTTPAANNTNTLKVKSVIRKSDTEYWVILEQNSKTEYYVMKNSIQVTDSKDQEIQISAIPPESPVTVTTGTENNVKYITSMKLQTSSGTNTAPQGSTITGIISRLGTSGDLGIVLADETTKNYFIDTNCVIMWGQEKVSISDVKVGDNVRITLEANTITKLEILTAGTGASTETSDGEVTAKSLKVEGYGLSLKQGTRTTNLVIDRKVKVIRNSKTAIFEDIKIGDKIKIIKEGTTITEIQASGVRTTAEGQVSGIYIGAVPQVTLKTKEGVQTFNIGETTEIYDNNQRLEVVLRDIKLGQNVELLIDSKEVVSLVIQRSTTGFRYSGSIYAIGPQFEYIDVLVDYDPLTESSRVIKRIRTPIQVAIEKSGRQEHRTIFEENMGLVVTYKYLEDVIPEKILIIQ